jgi:hypothetical protein
MKKNKNKGKKTLAAVGAVVAAGLTPGFVAATPQCAPSQDPNIEVTAAQVVAIGGNTYSFDELYAMQEPSNGPRAEAAPQHPTRYGTRPMIPQTPPPSPEEIYEIQVSAVLDTIQMGLLRYCIELTDEDSYTKDVYFTLDSDLTGEIGLSDYQLKELKAFIEEYYGVEVSYHRFRLYGQLNTLRLISEYIFKLKTVWD